MNSFTKRQQHYCDRVNHKLVDTVPPPTEPDVSLQAAMHYSLTAGGKRIRPSLVYATGEALQLPLDDLDDLACAVEIIHTYSLVHDDLPAMDDDDIRRGKPTCHKQFDEATAILAGDALQALAFAVISKTDSISADIRLKMIAELARASGHTGMAYGQAIDLAAVGQTLTLAQLERMHRHKTGALIRACVIAPALNFSNATPQLMHQLGQYADAIGLAFQIIDDILDVTSDTETLGKQQGADAALGKPTYPTLLGLDGALEHARQCHRTAIQSLDECPKQFDILRDLSSYIIDRSY